MKWRSKTFLGWILFGTSGVFFLVPAIQNKDVWALGAAITWLLGVALFVMDEAE